MGMPNSKFGKEIPINEFQEGSVPSTPLLTPKTVTLSEMDPRSPSLHISRTPIELIRSMTEKLDLSNEEETPVKNKFILGIDPRSPTTDFKRTPIIIEGQEGEFPKKIHNKNLDKVLRLELHTSPKRGSLKPLIPPKLLESSPIKSRPNAHKRRSFAGLLETNIDFTETDLDSVIKEKYKTEEVLEVKNNNDLQEIDHENKNDLIIEKQLDHNINSELKCDVQSENVQETNTVKDNINQGIKDLDIQNINLNDRKESNDNSTNDYLTDIREICDENSSGNGVEVKSAPISPINKAISPILPSKEVKSAPVTPPMVNLTADIKELDKKLTNIIYEDDLVVCPRIVKLKENRDRSPLKNCNGNEKRVKSAQKLKVSDNPRKSDYMVSKIPVYKEKKSGKKNGIQCENTPPRFVEKAARNKKSDWDTKNNTLYL